MVCDLMNELINGPFCPSDTHEDDADNDVPIADRPGESDVYLTDVSRTDGQG